MTTEPESKPEPHRDLQFRQLRSFTSIACAVALLLALSGQAYLGFFTRYVADDYCLARTVTRRGFWGSQIWTYYNHSGRFFSYLARESAEVIGHQYETRFLAAILLICWVAATTWAVMQFARFLGWRTGFVWSLVLSELIVFATLRTAPDPGQAFYWQAGAFTYTVPLILLTLYIGLIPAFLSRKESSVAVLAAGALLTIGAAGCSETNAALQCSGIGMALLFCSWSSSTRRRRRAVLPILCAGLLGSALGTIIVVAAPGNAMREAPIRASVPALSVAQVVAKSLHGSVALILKMIRHRPMAALALVVIPIILTWFCDAGEAVVVRGLDVVRACALGCLFAFALILITFAPAVYAFSTLPPGRAELAAQWILLIALASGGIAVGAATCSWYLRQNRFLRTAPAFLVLLLVLPWTAWSLRHTALARSQLRRYAAEWDAQDAQIRRTKALGRLDLIVPWSPRLAVGGNVTGLEPLSGDAANWVNKCIADYYGIDSLRMSWQPLKAESQTDALQVQP